ncbi:hypothetical protein HYU09_04425 [Candidatus Woesearchaeota archaeon]|nr:hypothetical protein [Candidatus Woesearchaeota archaeon]
MNPKTVRSPRSLAQYEIDPILRRYLQKFLDGKADIPGVAKREIWVSKLVLGMHTGGLEVQLEGAPPIHDAFPGYGSADYVMSVGEFADWFRIKGRKEEGKDHIVVETMIKSKYVPVEGQLSNEEVPYSHDENLVIAHILGHLNLYRREDDFQTIYAANWVHGGFRPHSSKKLNDAFERLYVGRQAINNFLARHGEIAKAALDQVAKYERK